MAVCGGGGGGRVGPRGVRSPRAVATYGRRPALHSTHGALQVQDPRVETALHCGGLRTTGSSTAKENIPHFSGKSYFVDRI